MFLKQFDNISCKLYPEALHEKSIAVFLSSTSIFSIKACMSFKAILISNSSRYHSLKRLSFLHSLNCLFYSPMESVRYNFKCIKISSAMQNIYGLKLNKLMITANKTPLKLLIQHSLPTNTVNSQQGTIQIESNRSFLLSNLNYQEKDLDQQIQRQIPIQQQRKQFIMKMIEQLQSKGAKMNSVHLVEENSSQCKMVSNSMIASSQFIIKIPQKCIICLDNIKQMNIPFQSPKHTLFAIFLLQQRAKGQNSVYFNYINSLPRKYDNFPHNYDNTTLELLQGSPFLEIIQRKKKYLEQDYKLLLLHSKDYNIPQVSFQDFKSMRLAVASRVFAVHIKGRRIDALVPLAEMLNHDSSACASWRYQQNAAGNKFIVSAVKNIPPNKQVCVSYGVKSNARFLISYGFTLQNKSANVVVLYIIIQMIKTPSKILPLTLDLSSRIFKEFIADIRAQVFKEEGRQKIYEFRDFESEKKVWNIVQKIVLQQLDKYPTTIKEDNNLLKQQLTINQKNCIRIRQNQKQILLFYKKMSKKIHKCFDNKITNFIYKSYFNDIGMK